MGILSDFFIADATTVPEYQGSDAFGDADKCEFQYLTPLQAAQFFAVLRGQKYVVEMIKEFELVTPENAENWTMTVPDEMVTALSKIEDVQISNIASQFAEATREELGWSPEEFAPIVTALVSLAQRAIATNKRMYLWNSL